MTERVLLATHNPGKVREMRAILSGIDIEVLTPEEVGISNNFDVVETGETFEENAELKARAFADAAGNMYRTLADDSGLCVNALDGDPGVHSKRFFPGTDDDRCMQILKLLADKNDRSAFFVAVLCLFDPRPRKKQKQIEIFRGEVTGEIAPRKEGQSGFGYDPVFIPDGFDQTFAQLGPEIKNKLSHRARALEQLKSYFLKQSKGNNT